MVTGTLLCRPITTHRWSCAIIKQQDRSFRLFPLPFESPSWTPFFRLNVSTSALHIALRSFSGNRAIGKMDLIQSRLLLPAMATESCFPFKLQAFTNQLIPQHSCGWNAYPRD
ncbi:unnamed protein product [Mycena citricolor]|uniref:Uncharacterized protein n=1 Tax=Mycena citricolor TaxID=2018698 RepID=A0AAD2HYD6_9AGAR|nr:unnamed protein product [Mycena citricolor]